MVSQQTCNIRKRQLKITFLLSLFNILYTFHIYSPTFFANPKEFWCARPDDFKQVDHEEWIQYTQSVDRCKIHNLTGIQNITNIPQETPMEPCKIWEFQDGEPTIIEDFMLVCDRQYLSNLSEMGFFIGVIIGGLVCGLLSDKFGRKKTLRYSALAQAIFGTLIAFAPYFYFYFILRALLGFVSVSVVFSGFVLLIEFTTGRWRTICGLAYFFSIPLGYVLMAGTAWLLRDWRYLQFAISLPGLLFMVLCYFLPESPIWLRAMGSTEEVPENLEEPILRERNRNEEEPNMNHVPTKKKIKATLLLSVIWFSVYLIYYGLTLNTQSIGWGIHVNTVIDGVMGILATALSIPILLRTGRRYIFLITTTLLSGCITLSIILPKITVPDVQWPVTALTIIGKLFITPSLPIMHVLTAELYPTTKRNTGMGISNVSAGIAFMLIPYIYTMVHKSVPLIILGISGVAGGICALFLEKMII